MHVEWYWFVPAVVAMSCGGLRIALVARACGKLDALGAICMVLATGFTALAITRDIPFVIVFGVVFGLLLVLAAWRGVRIGLRIARNPRQSQR